MNQGDEARRERHESRLEQLDRNWTDLLQELRVTQTGVQLLTGFLLTLPFQNRFADLNGFQRTVYLFTMAASVVATAFLVAPVSLHRTLFRQHAMSAIVRVAHRLASIGIILLGLSVVGVTLLIFSVVLGDRAGIIAAAAIAAVLLVLWLVLPVWQRVKNNSASVQEDVPDHQETPPDRQVAPDQR